jgi:hypothetical protein
MEASRLSNIGAFSNLPPDQELTMKGIDPLAGPPCSPYESTSQHSGTRASARVMRAAVTNNTGGQMTSAPSACRTYRDSPPTHRPFQVGFILARPHKSVLLTYSGPLLSRKDSSKLEKSKGAGMEPAAIFFTLA